MLVGAGDKRTAKRSYEIVVVVVVVVVTVMMKKLCFRGPSG